MNGGGPPPPPEKIAPVETPPKRWGRAAQAQYLAIGKEFGRPHNETTTKHGSAMWMMMDHKRSGALWMRVEDLSEKEYTTTLPEIAHLPGMKYLPVVRAGFRMRVTTSATLRAKVESLPGVEVKDHKEVVISGESMHQVYVLATIVIQLCMGYPYDARDISSQVYVRERLMSIVGNKEYALALRRYIATYITQADQNSPEEIARMLAASKNAHFRVPGVWIPADTGPLPFVMDGWTTSGSGYVYDGWLLKGQRSVIAENGRFEENEISR